VNLPIEVALEARRAFCQDYASYHDRESRALGIQCRYESAYLITRAGREPPPPANPPTRRTDAPMTGWDGKQKKKKSLLPRWAGWDLIPPTRNRRRPAAESHTQGGEYSVQPAGA